LFPHCATANSGPRPPLYREFMITLRHITLYECSARHRYLYLTKHNTRKRQTSKCRQGSESQPASGRRPRDHCDRILSYTAFKCLYLKTKDRGHFSVPTCWNLFLYDFPGLEGKPRKTMENRSQDCRIQERNSTARSPE